MKKYQKLVWIISVLIILSSLIIIAPIIYNDYQVKIGFETYDNYKKEMKKIYDLKDDFYLNPIDLDMNIDKFINDKNMVINPLNRGSSNSYYSRTIKWRERIGEELIIVSNKDKEIITYGVMFGEYDPLIESEEFTKMTDDLNKVYSMANNSVINEESFLAEWESENISIKLNRSDIHFSFTIDNNKKIPHR
ncbi:hypothetical protein [Alkaliphilus sp. B6464]|uniref:hypothetical protein n=1 Tax=Alkaliphilus sp. B6464 TaxID=2731219 RepID=UPI001BA59881|nr:hypothetical protein [Alkaliphilus sp. B6464]QUH21820.1 hypothetical protein HYG84_17950 [Alkaliphilus sp. B6464]